MMTVQVIEEWLNNLCTLTMESQLKVKQKKKGQKKKRSAENIRLFVCGLRVTAPFFGDFSKSREIKA